MAHHATLWTDDSCSSDRLYTFRRREDLDYMQNLSIDRSWCYLERFVFDERRPDGTAYEREKEIAVRRRRSGSDDENFLHRRVVYWKAHRHVIAFDAFLVAVDGTLPQGVVNIVRSYCF